MVYVSVYFYVFVLLSVFVYYIVPLKRRWIVLLFADLLFYIVFLKKGFVIFVITILLSFLLAKVISIKKSTPKKLTLIISIIFVILPWFLLKYLGVSNILAPIGISFYTLQIIAYLIDVYREGTIAQSNFLKYLLFVSFFPQIIQGPIPRYNQLESQLLEGNKFVEQKFVKGLFYILGGFFLKFMIADKAGIIVGAVFDEYTIYAGTYIWVASILYSIQLYTDFLACTTLSRGVALLFGIEIIENFKRPYFSSSVKDFWKRWHISLSMWLRDYIYIPLGGNRKGRARQITNLFITFLISGFWHGSGIKFIVWGMVHALYQLIEIICDGILRKTRLKDNFIIQRLSPLKYVITFFMVDIAWVIFRADTLSGGKNMLVSMFTVYNPWILFNDRLYSLGLDQKDFFVLIIAILFLFMIEYMQEKGLVVWEYYINQNIIMRWFVFIGIMVIVMVFGTYGYGYNAQDFIYGGF